VQDRTLNLIAVALFLGTLLWLIVSFVRMLDLARQGLW
jgi:hypothetical protein